MFLFQKLHMSFPQKALAIIATEVILASPITANAAETPLATFTPVDQGQSLTIDLSDGYTFSPDGRTVTSPNGTVIDHLPESVTDHSGASLPLEYQALDSDTVKVTPRPTSQGGPFINLSWWSDWGKCLAGTIGTAGGGAIGGAAAGTEVPVLGNTVGAIAGGISGGLAGAANYC